MNGSSHASTSSAAAGPEEDVTLSTLLTRTLSGSSSYLESGSNQADDLTRLLSDLSLCSSLINHLQLLSPNESIEELPTGSLRALVVEYYTGMLELQRRTRDYNARKEVLLHAQRELKSYLGRCEQYEVLDEQTRKRLYLGSSAARASDPAKTREAKIAQYKEERALKQKVEAFERAGSSISSTSKDGTLNQSTLEDSTDEYLRPLLLAQIQLFYLKAFSELSSISQELEILNAAPNMSELPDSRRAARQIEDAQQAQDPRARLRKEQEDSWKLDDTSALSSRRNDPSQLIDSSGRVLRPFTILPSSSSTTSYETRLRLQSTVFGDSHRLPTMSIDEYLAIEQERGNILQGGGAKNSEESRLEGEAKRAWETEEDNQEGYDREEGLLGKKREEDDYRDSHRRGEGNRINQG